MIFVIHYITFIEISDSIILVRLIEISDSTWAIFNYHLKGKDNGICSVRVSI